MISLLGILLLTMGHGSGPDSARVPGVAVERRLAEKFSFKVGDTVRFAASVHLPSTRFVVRAIYQPRPDPSTALRGEYLARFHLPDLANLLGTPDQVDRVAVRIPPSVTPDSAVKRLNQLAFGFRAWPASVVANQSSRTFLVVNRFHRAIGLIAIVASAIFLLCIMLLKVEERRLDAAVMRMIGLGRRTVFKAILFEATSIAVIGSVLGIVMAFLASALTNWYYRRKFETLLTFSYLSTDIVITGVAISLALGIVIGAAAAARLINVSPMALWRRSE